MQVIRPSIAQTIAQTGSVPCMKEPSPVVLMKSRVELEEELMDLTDSTGPGVPSRTFAHLQIRDFRERDEAIVLG